MNVQDLQVGGVYMVKGGHLLRYIGPYARASRQYPTAAGPCLAFRDVRDRHFDTDVPTGASIAPSDVLYRIEPKHRKMLEFRREQGAARALDDLVDDVDFILKELGCE